MPSQQRVGLDHLDRLPPRAAQPGDKHHHEPVHTPEGRPIDAAAQDDQLLAEKGVLGKQLPSASHRVAGS